MKLFNIKEDNIDKFFEVVDSCEGNVYIVSDDFKLNLKSRFTQYVSIAKIFFNEKVDEIELVVEKSEDRGKFLNFMMYS